MRKFLQEVIYWIALLFTYNYWKDKELDMRFATFSLMMFIVLNLMLVLFAIQLFTGIPTGDYIAHLMLANRDPSNRWVVEKYKLILYYAPFLILFSYIFYKIIFYKTNIKKVKKYYENMPPQQKKKRLWLTGIYIAFSVIFPLFFAALIAEQKKDRVHPKAEEQKIDTFYLDRLPDEANLLLPKKDTANKK